MTAGLVCTAMVLTVGCAEQTVVKEQKAESLPVIVVGSDNYPPFNYLNRYCFGSLYNEDGEVYIKLNLQIRFKK